MRRSRSRRYNVVPEPEPESNHNLMVEISDILMNMRVRGRFDHNTMNQLSCKTLNT